MSTRTPFELPSDWGLPVEQGTLLLDLESRGFKLMSVRRDNFHFGDTELKLTRDNFGVRVISDRGVWQVDLFVTYDHNRSYPIAVWQQSLASVAPEFGDWAEGLGNPSLVDRIRAFEDVSRRADTAELVRALNANLDAANVARIATLNAQAKRSRP